VWKRKVRRRRMRRRPLTSAGPHALEQAITLTIRDCVITRPQQAALQRGDISTHTYTSHSNTTLK
jgi:hypothetical protein